MYYIAANFQSYGQQDRVLSSSNQNIFTVSRLNAEVRLLLENQMGMVWLVGEISNFSAPVSGHWYFTLKDARAQVKCAMFRGNNRMVQLRPKNGQQVLVKARLSLYEPRGDYQLIVESMQAEGNGLLQQQFDELKAKLAAEGLFSQATKRPLPEHPTCVGIVTSKTGAALYDILDVLKRRDPSLSVVIYPTQVQGTDASIQIAQAIGRANTRAECDVLIVGRGGGSLEDLWCFNHEIVARTIAASTIPIISAVGHEVDVTIADFVADVRAPTPSAAAELVSRDHSHKAQQVKQLINRMQRAIAGQVASQKQYWLSLNYKFSQQHPKQRLERQSQQLDDLQLRAHSALTSNMSSHRQHLSQLSYRLKIAAPGQSITRNQHKVSDNEQRLIHAMQSALSAAKYQFALATETLDAVSPLSTIKRGYTIVRDENDHVITSATSLKNEQVIVNQFNDGQVVSVVKDIKD